MVGQQQCSCGLFHNSQPNSSCFSMLFSNPQHPPQQQQQQQAAADDDFMSSVDCTLSLGTPSTRLDSDHHHHHKQQSTTTPSSNYISNFCWDFLQSNNNNNNINQTQHNTRASANDPLLARRCANCDTTSTPLWRNGPRGPKSLCNACGIRFKKEERRATAATGSVYSGGSQSNQKVACAAYSHEANELRFIDNGSSDNNQEYYSSDHAVSFLSWRLNVTDRPTSLVHDFTSR